ncbi:MAG: hypothetical protein K2Q26_10150 [Bdellovibrionales bacterium]|nr:hypothetical protein [Bdellovibrionales bacterium]
MIWIFIVVSAWAQNVTPSNGGLGDSYKAPIMEKFNLLQGECQPRNLRTSFIEIINQERHRTIIELRKSNAVEAEKKEFRKKFDEFVSHIKKEFEGHYPIYRKRCQPQPEKKQVNPALEEFKHFPKGKAIQLRPG